MPDMETTEKKKITFRSLWRLCPARHVVLLVSLAWLAAYFLLRGNKAVMNALCRTLVRPWHAFAGKLFSAVPFSVTEWVILLLGALGVVLVRWALPLTDRFTALLPHWLLLPYTALYLVDFALTSFILHRTGSTSALQWYRNKSA